MHYQRQLRHGDTRSLTPTRGLPLEERFWANVAKTGANDCWQWIGYRVGTGYGAIRAGAKMVRAHRLSYEFVHGPIPAHLCVLHRCDTPSCVNPAHLFLGTQRDNIADEVSKGRQARGERHPFVKLTEQNVREIRRRAPHERYRALAAEFGVSHGTITSIAVRRTWRHI